MHYANLRMTAWLAILCALVSGCSPTQPPTDAAKAKAETTRQNKARRDSFATNYGAVWHEHISAELTVDVQRQLAGKRIAFDVFFPNVREEKEALILSGLVLSPVPLELEIKIDQQQLELVRSNRVGIWVAALIETVTPKREVHGDAGSAQMETVCYVSGKALGLASSKDSGDGVTPKRR